MHLQRHLYRHYHHGRHCHLCCHSRHCRHYRHYRLRRHYYFRRSVHRSFRYAFFKTAQNEVLIISTHSHKYAYSILYKNDSRMHARMQACTHAYTLDHTRRNASLLAVTTPPPPSPSRYRHCHHLRHHLTYQNRHHFLPHQ